ncbi:MAG: hypothetical protein KatS3mg061_0210 [Dehalococcoidia bacterium]|nr:MAG: hypothetical protein KatS3mg061_0210 [Dehalococcoidia bacterium]
MAAPAGRLSQGQRWLLVGVLLLAAALRLPALHLAPPGVNNDVAYDATDALTVLAGEWQLWFPGNFGREPAAIYLLAASTALFGRNELALRFPTAAAGVLLVAMMVPLARCLFRSRSLAPALAVLAAALAAVNFWAVFWSRLGFRAALLPLVLTLAFFLLARAAHGHRFSWVTAGAAFGGSLYTYTAARVFPLLLAVLWAGDALIDRRCWRSRLEGWRWLLVSVFIVALPLGAYFAVHPDQLVSRVGQLLPGGTSAEDLPPADPPDRAVLGSFAMFLGDGGGNWVLALPGRGVFDLLTLPPFLLGVVLALRRWRWQAERWILLWLLVLLLPAILAREGHPNYGRSLGALPPTLLLASLGAAEAGRWVLRRWQAPALVGAAGLVVVLSSSALTAHDYWLTWARHPETERAFAVPLTRFAHAANQRDDGRWFLLLANPARGEQFRYRVFDYLYRGSRGVTLLADEPSLRRWLAAQQPVGQLVEVVDFPPTRLGPDDPREVIATLLRAHGPLIAATAEAGLRQRVYRLLGPPLVLAPTVASTEPGPLGAQVLELLLAADRGALVASLEVEVSSLPAPDRLSLQLFDPSGQPLAQSERPLVDGAGRTPERWERPVRERAYFVLPLPAGLPPARYELRLAAYRQDGTLREAARPLLTFSLTEPVPLPADEPMTRLDRALAGGTVLGWVLPGGPPLPGEHALAIVFWQGPPRSFQLTLADQVVAVASSAATAAPQRLVFPFRAPRAPLTGSLLWLVSGDERLALGPLPLRERPRQFTPPVATFAADVRFGNALHLVGYDPDVVITPTRALDLTLYWRALRDDLPPLTPLIQVVAGDRVVAQRDGRPGAPTTTWLAGEYVPDGYEMLPLPAGLREVSVIVRVIEAATGAPLPTASGELGVRLGPFTVPP